MQTVAWESCERVVALLRRRGQWLDASPEDDRFLAEQPLLARLYGASISGTLVLGAKAGQRQLCLYGAAARPWSDGPPSGGGGGKVKNAYGFDVHAGVRVPADDRAGLERLARYVTRPPLSERRLERQADGRYRIALKTPWRDGTTHIVLDGPELVGRLAALVPPPRFHLTRYHGVFAPRSKLRRAVVPGCCDATAGCTMGCGRSGSPEKDGEPGEDSASRRCRRMSWSALLARVFAIDVLECPRCHSRLQRVELCTTASRINAVLGNAGTGPPERGVAA